MNTSNPNSYAFNNMGSLGFDSADISQKNSDNTRSSNYILSNYFSENNSGNHIQFATQQPSMMFSGTTHGNGLNPYVVEHDSELIIKKKEDRPLEKLQLVKRPYLTIPYLGRGTCDPTLESKLQQGENIHDKKSTSTIMEKSFSNYSMYILDDDMEEHVSNYKVEEAAINGWNIPTRLNEDEYLKKNSRPNINV